jgi:hypothetical protein
MAREDRWNDRALVRMMERDTISLAMSPAARMNRNKSTGNSALNLVVGTQVCNYKPDGEPAYTRRERADGSTYGIRFVAGDKCGAPASISKKVDGKMVHRCSEHIGMYN